VDGGNETQGTEEVEESSPFPDSLLGGGVSRTRREDSRIQSDNNRAISNASSDERIDSIRDKLNGGDPGTRGCQRN
jgi:hypothetical protein